MYALSTLDLAYHRVAAGIELKVLYRDDLGKVAMINFHGCPTSACCSLCSSPRPFETSNQAEVELAAQVVQTLDAPMNIVVVHSRVNDDREVTLQHGTDRRQMSVSGAKTVPISCELIVTVVHRTAGMTDGDAIHDNTRRIRCKSTHFVQ